MKEQFIFCPSSAGLWWRMYYVYVVNGEYHVCFVGHVPRNMQKLVDNPMSRRKAQRQPKLAALARDLVAICRALGVTARNDVEFELASQRPGQYNYQIYQGEASQGRFRIRQSESGTTRVAHICGSLTAYTAAALHFAPEGVEVQEAFSFEMAFANGKVKDGVFRFYRSPLYGTEEWSRLWCLTMFDGEPFASFVGHVPDPIYMAAERPELSRHFRAERHPRLQATARDVVAVAIANGVAPASAGWTLFGSERNSSNMVRTHLSLRADGASISDAVLQIAKVRHLDGWSMEVIEDGLFCPLHLLVRLVSELGYSKLLPNVLTSLELTPTEEPEVELPLMGRAALLSLAEPASGNSHLSLLAHV